MTKKKQYKNQLPAVLPPTPRRAPDQESVAPAVPPPAPEPELEQVREAIRQLVADLDDEPVVEPAPEAAEETAPGPVADPEPAPTPAPAPRPVLVTTSELTADTPPRVRRQRALARAVVLGVLVAFGGGYLLTRFLDDPGTASGRSEPAPASLLGAPQALLPGETYVDSEVQRGGDVLVSQWIRSTSPIDQVWLTLPETGGTGLLEADGIKVHVDDGAVAGPATLQQGQAIYTFSQTDAVRISYLLRGAVQTSDSVPGRALALATSIDVRVAAGTTRETRVVRAPEVLALGCAVRSETVQPCGNEMSRRQWRVELEGEQLADRVVAQVALER